MFYNFVWSYLSIYISTFKKYIWFFFLTICLTQFQTLILSESLRVNTTKHGWTFAQANRLALCRRVAPLWRLALRQSRGKALINAELWLAGCADVLVPGQCQHVWPGALPAAGPVGQHKHRRSGLDERITGKWSPHESGGTLRCCTLTCVEVGLYPCCFRSVAAPSSSAPPFVCWTYL